MEVQQTYKENIHKNNTLLDSSEFVSKSMSFKGRNLTDALWETLETYPSVEILVLDDNNITTLPKNILKKCFPRLRVLSMRKNKLTSLSAESLEHPTLEIADFEENTDLSELLLEEAGGTAGAMGSGVPPIGTAAHTVMFLGLLKTQIATISPNFFKAFSSLNKLMIHCESICGACGYGFLNSLAKLQCLVVTGARTNSCHLCKVTGGAHGAMGSSLYALACTMPNLVELDLSGKNMSIEYFVFIAPMPCLRVLRMQGKVVRDMSLRDWPGILKTLKHLTLGVIDDEHDANFAKPGAESTFYAERILEATNLESLSFDSRTNKKIKFSLGTKKVVFPHLRHLTIKNCDLRPLTFFNQENAPLLDSLEIVNGHFTEGYFYTIKKRLGDRLKSLRIGIENMDASQAIYDLFTFIRSHQQLDVLHLNVCESITESQSFYKYFSDRPPIKELYVIGRMNIHRMKRFLYQIGHCSTLTSLLLDIEEPSTVMAYFYPVFNLSFFSLKGTFIGKKDVLGAKPESPNDLKKLGGMKHLSVLDLSGCRLSVVPDNIISSLSFLSQLYINDNQLKDLPEDLVALLKTQKNVPLYIDISNNHLGMDKIDKMSIINCWLGTSGFILY
ncbi:hypothetical protein NEDG_01589 [Nematocida displodere]|uniref:Uncharacterized protein n=1 Tax=Nematocida displodere TaxID=1805483 RepID=A0A177EHJ0_9MICR|nr:hypothetical protein NEDG_01589 [Nematocida displodere]